MGLTLYRSMTRAAMPSSASCSAAERASWSVMPAPTRVTASASDDRTTRAPPIGNDSPGG